MSCCCSPLGGAPGGGAFAPIQQVRYLDPQFAGTTSTGSIAEPFKLFSEFFAALTGPFGWGLWLPGGPPMVEPVAVPAFLVGDVAFLGIDREVTVIETLTVGEQDGDRNLTFENLTLPLLTLEAGEHTLDFRHCRVVETVATGALVGRCRLVDCYAATLNLGTDMPLEFSGGTLDSGTTSFATGQFENVKFLQAAALVPGAGTTTFVGCNFAESNITISNANTPTLVMDAFSYASFLDSGVVFGGAIRVTGIPQAFYADLAVAGAVAAGTTGTSATAALSGAPYTLTTGFLLTCVVEWFAHVVDGYFQLSVQIEASYDGGGSWFPVGSNRNTATIIANNPTIMQATCLALAPSLDNAQNLLVRYTIANDASSASGVTAVSGTLTALACRL